MQLNLSSVALGVALLCVGGCSAADPTPHEVGDDSGVAGDAAHGVDWGADGALATDAGGDGSIEPDADLADVDAGADGGCFVSTVGVFGDCVTTTACTALGDHTSTPGYCPGAADIECCTVTPNVDDNPPFPTGWMLMEQADVTADMTTWAVDILHDPTTYPMFSTTIKTFGTLMVLARVEWHPPDFQNGVIHRGVTLYQPI